MELAVPITGFRNILLKSLTADWNIDVNWKALSKIPCIAPAASITG